MIIDLYASTRRECTDQSIGTWVFSTVSQIACPPSPYLGVNAAYLSATSRAFESKAFQANPSTKFNQNYLNNQGSRRPQQ